jgi:hypothetical protein
MAQEGLEVEGDSERVEAAEGARGRDRASAAKMINMCANERPKV